MVGFGHDCAERRVVCCRGDVVNVGLWDVLTTSRKSVEEMKANGVVL